MNIRAALPTESQWRLLLDMSRAIAATTDVDALLKHIAQAAVSLLECERASVFLHDLPRNELWTLVALQAGEIRVPANEGIVGTAFTRNQIVLVQSAPDDPRFNPEVDRRTGYTTRSLLAAPMLDIDGKPVGVIQALNKRGGTFSEVDRPLIQLLADQAGVAVQRHQLQLQAVTAAALRREMELARGLQQSMLPRKAPQISGMAARAWAATASLTGGDAYDLWAMPDGRMGIFLADAAGHGLAPALIVSQVRALVRAFCDEDPQADPDLLLGQVNRRISQDFEADRFVTAFLAFAGADRVLRWSSAGHGPVLVSSSERREFAELCPPHLPLGVSGEWTALALPPVQLAAGGMLVAPSDGMIEACNPRGEQFGAERLVSIVSACRGASLEELVDQVKHAVQEWQGGQVGADDQTFVIVRWDGPVTRKGGSGS